MVKNSGSRFEKCCEERANGRKTLDGRKAWKLPQRGGRENRGRRDGSKRSCLGRKERRLSMMEQARRREAMGKLEI